MRLGGEGTGTYQVLGSQMVPLPVDGTFIMMKEFDKMGRTKPERHPSSKSMFALKNPLRALELIGRKSANKNPENPKKMKRAYNGPFMESRV